MQQPPGKTVVNISHCFFSQPIYGVS